MVNYVILSKSESKFCSTQVNLSPEMSEKVRDLENHISPSHFHPTEKNGDDIHITVLYGLHDNDPKGVRELVEGIGPIDATILGVEVFRPEDKDYDVLVMTVDSPDLCALHRGLATLPHTDTFPDYHPHCTIAYLVRGAGDEYKTLVAGLEGEIMTFPTLMFSDKDHKKTEIPLTRGIEPPMLNPGDIEKSLYVIMKSEVKVKAYTRTRKGRQEYVKPFQRQIISARKERVGVVMRMLSFVEKKVKDWKGEKGLEVQTKKKFKFSPEQEKSEKTWMTKPQKQYVHKRMSELRKEVGIKPTPIAGKIGLSTEEYDGLRMMGYKDNQISKMGKESAKTAYWNGISPSDAGVF
jgi:2'-5' RNA ligase